MALRGPGQDREGVLRQIRKAPVQTSGRHPPLQHLGGAVPLPVGAPRGGGRDPRSGGRALGLLTLRMQGIFFSIATIAATIIIETAITNSRTTAPTSGGCSNG